MKRMTKKLVSLMLMTIMMLSAFCCLSVSAASDYKIVWIGGSYTQGVNVATEDLFATKVGEWYQSQYSNMTVTTVNKGVGGTGSRYGRLRFENDVVAESPDLVFIEFAGNGNDNAVADKYDVLKPLESMIRRLQSLPKVPKIAIVLRTIKQESLEAADWHEAVADYYGIRVIDTRDDINRLYDNGTYTQSDLLGSDNSHPNELGNQLIADAIISDIEKEEIKDSEIRKVPLTTGYNAIVPEYIYAKDLEYSSDWSVDENGYLVTETQNAVLNFSFKGDTIAIMDEATQKDTTDTVANNSRYTILLDATEEEIAAATNGNLTNEQYNEGCSWMRTHNMIFPQYLKINDLSDGEHTITIKVTGSNCKLSINAFIVDGIANSNLVTTENEYFKSFKEDFRVLSEIPVLTDAVRTTKNVGLESKGGAAGYNSALFTNASNYLQYKLTDEQIAEGNMIHSFKVVSAKMPGRDGSGNPITTRTPNEEKDITIYAVDNEGNETLITDYLVTDNKTQNSGWRFDTWAGCNLPDNTVAIKIVDTNTSNVQATRVFSVEYNYAIPSVDKINVNTPKELYEGQNISVNVKAIKSNGAESDMAVSDLEIYSTDENILMVDGTTVTAKAVGKGQLYISCTAEGKEYTKLVDINVKSSQNVENIRIEADKNKYAVGVSGKVDLLAEIDGKETVDTLNAVYTALPAGIINLNSATGEFTTLKEGTVTISADVAGFDAPSSIALEIIGSGLFVHNVRADYDTDNTTLPLNNWGATSNTIESVFGNAKYFAHISRQQPNNDKLSFAQAGGVFCSAGSGSNVLYIYELPENTDEVNIDFRSYVAGEERIEFYVCDSEISTSLNFWGLAAFCLKDSGLKHWNINSENWDKVNYTYETTLGLDAPARRFSYTITDIPANAKYIMASVRAVAFTPNVMVTDETLASTNTYSEISGNFYSLEKVVIRSKAQIINSAFADDSGNTVSGAVGASNLKLTFNRGVTVNSVTATKNGTDAGTIIGTYNSGNFTYTASMPTDIALDDSFTYTLNVTDEYNSTYDLTYSFKAEDTRAQISAVSFKGADKTATTNLIDAFTDENDGVLYADASCTALKNSKVMFALVVFDGNNKVQNINISYVDVIEGEASVNDLSVTVNKECTNGWVAKLFVWDGTTMSPVNLYKDLSMSIDYQE